MGAVVGIATHNVRVGKDAHTSLPSLVRLASGVPRAKLSERLTARQPHCPGERRQAEGSTKVRGKQIQICLDQKRVRSRRHVTPDLRSDGDVGLGGFDKNSLLLQGQRRGSNCRRVRGRPPEAVPNVETPDGSTLQSRATPFCGVCGG